MKSGERKKKRVRKAKGKSERKRERRASLGDLPVLVLDSEIVGLVEKDDIVDIRQQFFFFVGGRVYLVNVRVTVCCPTVCCIILLSRRG